MSASNAKPSAAPETKDRELIFRRVFNAPREVVFAVWTDPRHVAKWWGPNGFSTTIQEMDVRPGGDWRLVMHGPDGRDYKNRIVFVEVVKPERLVYKHVPEKGTEPVGHESTVTFADLGGKTEVTMRLVFASAAAMAHVVKTYNAVEGGKQTLGRLGELLTKMAAGGGTVILKAADKELILVRVFDAPRELVFKAWTKAEHLSRWFHPKGFTTPKCESDFRAGGVFRFVLRGPDGKDYPFDGSWVEIVEPERLVFHGNIHDVPGQDVLTTITFAEFEGKTKLTVHQVYAVESFATQGAPQGWTQTLDNLGEFLAGAKS